MKRILLLPFLVVFLAFSFTVDNGNEQLEKALEKIDSKDIRAYMKFLSHDLLEGRGTGTRGHEVAAHYVATQFDVLGLQPGGENNTYFQEVPLVKGMKRYEGSEITLIGQRGQQALSFMEDYLFIDAPAESLKGKMEVVFAGFGISEPDQGHDDYKDIEVKDRFVAIFSGTPANFKSEGAAGSRTAKFQEAKKRGAKGIIYLLRPEDSRNLTWDVLTNYFYNPSGRGISLRTEEETAIEIIMSPAGLQKFIGDHKLEDLLASNGDNPVKEIEFSLNVSSDDIEYITSPNVIGIVEGSDPELKDEYIVYTAHLDHEGIGTPVRGDSIYNGAYDNASGTAILLEVAQAFASLEEKPKRSIMFIALTAEEKGLLGSKYFASNPTVPKESLAANVNTDMFLMEEPLREIVVLGAPFSDLGQYAEEAASELELEIVPDPVPEENLFVRSDHYSFVEQGVPALFVVNNYKKPTSEGDTTAVNTRWLKTIYHSPQDEFREDMNFEAGEKYGRFNFLVGYRAAQQEGKIKWKKDNIFGQRFGS
ncbi:M20/M25/M40 family metallo-hydrolase [soil metagenome]